MKKITIIALLSNLLFACNYNGDAYVELGLEFYNSEKYDKAIEYLRKGITMDDQIVLSEYLPDTRASG
jgi:hypothetical protein